MIIALIFVLMLRQYALMPKFFDVGLLTERRNM